MNGDGKRVLLVYYTFTQQTGSVIDVMAGALKARGCEVTQALIEFTDPHYSKRFAKLPMRFPVLKIVGMLPAQARHKTGEIGIPPEAREGDYDLVVFGSPTWWLTTNMPVRSYLKSPEARKILDGKPFAAAYISRRYWKDNIKTIRELGEAGGGTWAGETHFVSAGGQVMSMVSWLTFMFFGGPKERLLGIKLPSPNLQPDFAEQARTFINGVADRAPGQTVTGGGGR